MRSVEPVVSAFALQFVGIGALTTKLAVLTLQHVERWVERHHRHRAQVYGLHE